jgi:hypothetical protein
MQHPHVGEMLRIQQKRAITYHNTLVKAKLTDESKLAGPFPHPDAGKGIRQE